MRLTISFLWLFILCEIHGEEENEKFLCTKAGRYENPKDETCNSFFLCSYTLEGELIQTQYSCPEKSVFSPETALCSKNYTCPKLSRSTRDVLQIENVNNVHYRCRNGIENDFKCRRSGKYADLIGTSCRRYFMCSLLRSGEYVRTQYECPEGSFFDPRTQKCHLNYECPCQMISPENVNWHRDGRREHNGWSERSREAEINEKWTKTYRWTRIPQPRPTREAASTTWPSTDDCIDTGNVNLFKCKNEGLYPDKKDVTCTDYFLCNRLPNGGFLRTKYSCPYGSTFDPHTKNCSMQYVCPCQFATRSTYSTTLTPSPRTVKPSTTTEIVHTTESKPTPLDCEIPRKKFECERTGRFPDRTDLSCNTYYLCEISSIGELKKKRYRCPRCLTFDPALEKCTDNYVCPCSSTEAPGVTTSIPVSSQTPKNGSETEKTTKNGSTNTSPTKPDTSESTTEKMNSQTTPNASSTTNDCSIPANNKPFKCQSRGRFPDKTDLSCSSYFICSERKNGSFEKTKAKCPKNSHFDPSAKKCSENYECPCSGTSGRTSSNPSSTTSRTTSTSRKTTKSTSITENTQTPHSETTTTESKSTGQPSLSTSEPTPAASSSSTKKSSDCNIPPSNEPFRCILKGRFPNRKDLTCSSYFLCSALNNSTLIKTKYRCPKNSLFDPSLHRCSKTYECPCANNPSTTEESPKSTTSKSGMKSTTMNPTDITTQRESTSKRATAQTKSSTDSKTTSRRSTSSSEKTESTEATSNTIGSSERPTSKQTGKSESTTANPGTSASQKDVTAKSTNGSMGTTKSRSSLSTQKSSETSSICIVPSNNETFRCESKGRFPDRRDSTCSSYFLCSALNNGTLIKTKYRCPRNSFFDPSLQKCSKGYECPCVNIPSTTSKYSSITTKSTGKPTSSSINPTDQTIITKSSGRTKTSTDSKSTESISTSDSGRTESTRITTTQKDKSTKLTTEQTNGSRATTQQPDNSSTQRSSGTPEDCIIPPKNKPFSCTSKGRFPNRRDSTCSSYFLCSALNNGTLIRTKYNCPKKSYFDPTIQRCSKSYECPCSKSSGGTTKHSTIIPSKATEQTTGSGMTVKTTEQSSFTESSRQKSTITRSTDRTKSSRESNPTERLTTANSGGTESTKVTSPGTTMRGSSGRPTVSTSAKSEGSESTTENPGSSSSQKGSSSELTSEKTNGSEATTTRPASSSTENGSATPDDCIIPASNKPFKCRTKGRFADKRDLTCSSYFLCSALNNGTLIKTKYKCPQQSYFDPSIHRCNKSYKCPCSTVTTTTTKYSTITPSGTTGRATASKITSISTDDSTVTESTKQRSTITARTKTSSKSAATTTSSEIITKSTRATSSKETHSTSGQPSGSGSSTSQSGITTDRTSEKTNGSKATTKQSDLSSTQNSGGTSDGCIIPPANKPFRCLSKGRFPDRRDTTCSSYFLCSALNNGTLIRTKYNCPKKSYFDPSIQKCSRLYECPCSEVTSTTAKYSSTTSSLTRRTTVNNTTVNPTEGTSNTQSSQKQSTITRRTEQTKSENSRSTERLSTASSDRTKSTKVIPPRTSMSSPSGSPTLSTSGQSIPSKSTTSASPTPQKVSSTTTKEPEQKSTSQQKSFSTTTEGSATPDACIIPPSNEVFRCTSKGRFADKRDLTCSTYFLCSALNNGTLIKTKYKCPRMSYFDPSIHRCSKTYECPCTAKTVTTSKYLTTSTSKTTRQSPTSSSGETLNPTGLTESTISTGTESAITENTKASISSRATGKTSTTRSGRTSSSENTSSRSSISTSFTENTGSTSSKSSSNGSESTKVTSTTKNGSTSSIGQSTGSTTRQPLSSPTTTEGSSSSQEGSSIPNDCIIPPANKPFKCRSKGRFPNKRDLTCSSYFLCSSIEGDIFIKTKHECPRNSYFNPSIKRCSRSYECPCSNIPSITPKSISSTTFKTTKQSVPSSTESSKFPTQNEGSSSKQASTSESITERTKPSSRSISTASSRTEATKTTSSSRYTQSTSASAKTETTSPKSVTVSTSTIRTSEKPITSKPTTKRAETSGSSITSSDYSSTSRTTEKPSSSSSDNSPRPSETTDKNKSTKHTTTSRRSEKTTVTESTKSTSTAISDRSDSTGKTTSNGSKGSTSFTEKTRRTSSKTESTAIPTRSTEESTGSESTTVRQSSSTDRGSSTSENCIIPPSNKPFKCSSNGRFPNRRDLTCSSYFLCSSIEGDIFVKTKHECPRNSFFDPSVRRCSRTYECPCSNSPSTTPNSEASSHSSSSSSGANNHSTEMNKSTVTPKQTTSANSSSGNTKSSSSSESSTSSTPVSRQTESTASSSMRSQSPSAATRAENTSSGSESTNLTSKQPNSSMSTTEDTKSSRSSATTPSNNSPTVTSRTSEKSPSSRSSRFTAAPSETTGKTKSTKQTSRSESSTVTTERNSKTTEGLSTTFSDRSGSTGVPTWSGSNGSTPSTRITQQSTSSKSDSTGFPTRSTMKSTVSESTTVQQSSSSSEKGSNTPENCIIPPSNKPFKCSSNGRFPNKRDLTCSSYFLCASIEGDIFIKSKHECPRNSFFDPSLSRCSTTYKCPCSNSPSTTPNSGASSPSSSSSTGANNHSTEMSESTVSPKLTTPANSSSGKTKSSSSSESSASSTPVSRQTESTASSSRGSRSPSASTIAENTSSGSESTNLTSKKPNSSASTTDNSKSTASNGPSSDKLSTVTSRTSEKSSSSRSSRFTTAPSESTAKTKSTKQTARSESSTVTTERNSKTTGGLSTTFSDRSGSTGVPTWSGSNGSTPSTRITQSTSSKSDSTGFPTRSTMKSTVSESTTVQQSSSSSEKGSNTPENCIIPPSNKPFKCSSNGRFPNKRDLTCSSYFLCASIEGDIFIKTKHECPRNSFFDPSLSRCSKTYECPCSNSPSTTPNSGASSPSSSSSTGANNHSTEMSESTVSPKLTTPANSSSGKTKSSSSSESSTSSTPVSGQTENTASSSRNSRSPSASTIAENTSSGSESTNLTSKKPNSSASTTDNSKSTSRSSKFTIAPSETTGKTKSTKQVTTTKGSTETSDKTSASKSTRSITTTSSKISESTGGTTSGRGDSSTSSPGITSSDSKSTRPPTRSTGYQSSTTLQENSSSTQRGSNTPEKCIIPPSNKPFKCSSNGRFPNRRDLTCSSYFLCASIEGDIFIKTKHECPRNSYFDPSTKRCSRTYECPCSNMRSTTSTESSNQSQNPNVSTEKPRTSSSSMSTRKISTTPSGRTDTTGSLSSKSSTSKSTERTPSKSVPTKRPGKSTTTVSTGSQSTNEQQGSSSTDKSSSAGEECIIPASNEPFVCLSKGRFPDRRDLTCSAYFLCSALSNGTLIKTAYNCPRNSYFDPSIHRCSREYNCPCSHKTTSSPKLSSSTTPRSTGPSSSTSSGRFTNTANVTRFTISTSERVSRNSESTGSQCITPPSDYKFVCKSNGRFPNIQDQTCSSYYLCSSLSDGTFVQAKYRCGSGSKFDPSLQNCSASYECPCTIATTTPVTSKVSTVSTVIPDVCQPTGKEFVCTAVGRYPKPGDVSCCTYYSCSKSDNGTIIQTEFSCPEGSSFDPVFKTCSKSYRCPCHVTESPQYFTTSSENCVIPTEDFVCSSPGRFPNRQDVSCCNYFLCSDIGNGTYIRTEYNCPMGKSFDPELKRCSSSYVCPCRITENSETPVTTVMTTAKPTTAGSVTQPPGCDLSPENPEHICTLRGRFKDTKDITCTNYFLCSKLKNGTFIRTRYTCPRFSYFDPSLGLCTTTYKCPCINTFSTPTRSTGRITKIPGTRAPWHINTRKTTQTPAPSDCVPLSPAISEFACSAEGKFMNPLDTRCTSYIHCVRRASVLVKTVVNCEGMTAFDITLKKCTANAVCKICK